MTTIPNNDHDHDSRTNDDTPPDDPDDDDISTTIPEPTTHTNDPARTTKDGQRD
jgi:hypothetical protein